MHQSQHVWWRGGFVMCALLIVVLMPTLSTVGLISGRITKALAAKPTPLAIAPFVANSAIARENQEPGTTAWMLDPGVNTTLIQGYAGVASARANDRVPLYISTAIPIEYTLDVYRMGWYGGNGARLMLSADHLHGTPQGLWTPREGLVDCATCQIDEQTRLIDASWAAAYQLVIPPDWLSGAYLIKLSVGKVAESYIPLVVRDDVSPSGVLVNLPVMTYQAYNIWGGFSLYGNNAQHNSDGTTAERAYKVSFNRPYARNAGAGDFLTWDIHTIRWLERNGVDATYTTDVDVARAPGLLKDHLIYLDSGHDEYWTLAMRDGVEQARDAGVSLAFLGANDSYWQARLEDDATGNSERTLVCYKASSLTKDPRFSPKLDPMYPDHRTLVTAQWRDPILKRPENSLLGLMYSSYFSASLAHAPDMIIAPSVMGQTLLTQVGLRGGERISGGVLGYEYDRVFENGRTPKNLVVVAQSPVTNVYRSQDFAQSAYYRAPSGALVFDAGSIWWSYGLDDFAVPGAPISPTAADPTIGAITTVLLQNMLLGPHQDPPSFQIAP